MSAPNRRLCVCWLFRRLGDSLLATSAIRAIKKSFPECKLVVIAEHQVTRVFQFNPWIDQVVTLSASSSLLHYVRALRHAGKPWCVVDFLSSPRTALTGFLSRAEERIGIGIRGRRWAQTRTVEPQDTRAPVYSADHKLALAIALGAKPDGPATEFYLTEHDISAATRIWKSMEWDTSIPIAAFFVGSRRSYKVWPSHRFAEVIRWIKDSTAYQPLVLHTPGDDESVGKLKTQLGPADVKVASVTDIGVLGAVLARCRVLIGNDGGPKHVAAALGISTFTIFGNEPHVYWTPPDSRIHGVAIPREGHGVDGVSVNDVIDKVQQLLAAVSR